MSVEPTVPGRVSFLSDYGLEDEFVGIVHAVIDRRAPGTRVIDVTHAIRPHDVAGGAMALWRSAPWLVPGVILAVVDPGVGTRRRAVAFEVAAAGAYFVGPDNGLLLPAALRLGPVSAAVGIDASPVASTPGRSAQAGHTFDGRDVFAPAAALLASGFPLSDLGQAFDPSTLIGSQFEAPRLVPETAEIVCTSTWVDRFGNVQLNASRSDLVPLGSPSLLKVVLPLHPSDAVAMRIVRAYADLVPDEPGLVVDSYGLLAISLREASAADRLGVAAGEQVRLQVDQTRAADQRLSVS